MPAVPVCDILGVSPEGSQQKKLPNLPRQSARIKASGLNKTTQNDVAHVTHKDDETENKLKNGYDAKTFYSNKKVSIDILSEVKSNSGKKRKANFEEKTNYGSNKNLKQIKVEKLSDDEEEEENMESEYSNEEKSFEDLSEYEKMRQRNIEEKMAFFASLNFNEVKLEFEVASAATKNQMKLAEKPKKLLLKKERPSPTSVRKSLRLQRIDPEGQPLPPKPEIVEPVTETPRKPHKPLTFEEVFKSQQQSSDKLVKDMCTVSQEAMKFESVPYDRYESYFSTMRIKSSLVTKVAPSRVFSLAIHPSSDKTLICAGSKYGHLSFWDVGSKNPQGGVYVYEPHSRPVNCVAFNVNKPHQVISLSYDGTARCGHLEAGIFDEVFYTSDDDYGYIWSTCFDFLSPDSFIVSQSSGTVSVVDMRTPRHGDEISHLTHPCPIKTVSVHPMQKDYFIAAGRNGVVSLWDLRLMKKSVADIGLPRCCNSAYFSPVTGNSVLTTSMDDKLCVFDTMQLKGPFKQKTGIRHDNHTGRWLTGFRAVWLPYNEDAFIVGSMQQPRRIEVYRTNGRLAQYFAGEDLASVCSINVFHPSRPILAGANSSGKLHVFKGKE